MKQLLAIAAALMISACSSTLPPVERQPRELWKETPGVKFEGAADITAKPVLIDENAHPTVAIVIKYASGRVQQFYFEVVDALGFADEIKASVGALRTQP